MRVAALATWTAVAPGSVGAVLPAGAEPVRWPEAPLLALDGQPLDAASGDWKCLYLDFWASWCAPCRLSFPWMNEAHDRWGARGLRVLAVGLDRKTDDGRRFAVQAGARFAVALDPQAQWGRHFQVKAMPTSYLVHRTRGLLWKHEGFRTQDAATLSVQLAQALELA
jgi:thiol-disulfide isomerase/thioredoxin